MVRHMPISTAAKVILGQSPPGTTYNANGVGLPLLNGPTEFGATYPDWSLYTTDSRRECEPGDLIFCVRGSTTGRTNWADRKFSLGRGVCAFRGASQAETRFIHYCIQDRLHALLQLAGGGTFPNLTKDSIESFEIPWPENRVRIAGILSAYDELIDNSQQRIKILESMARALYCEWFVYFRFPGHESVPLVPSSLGDLPQGWDVLEFRHLFDIRYGKTLPKSEISDSGIYPVYGAGDVIGFYDKMLYLNKCALVTSRGNGSGTVWRTREAAFVTNNSLVILPQEDRSHWEFSFIELLLKHSNVMGARTGSAQPQVTIENLNYVRAIVPSGPLVKQFCAIASPLYEQVDLLFRQIRNIRQIRDLLLPRLLSGQIEVEAVAS